VLNHRLPPVLAIEDSLDDIEFMRRAFVRCRIEHPLVVAEDGEEALALLRGECPHSFGPGPLRPALILLDLNMPGIGGRELLKRLKSDEALRPLPVAVFTTSTHRRDVETAYRLGANSYHCKPHDVRGYEETILGITNYWLSAAVLPVSDEAVALASVGAETSDPQGWLG
jgi:CheY-like chemotaxis protein